MRDTLGPLEVFLAAATAALDAGISPTDLATELQKHMLDSSERLDYHLDGDLPMVMYRLWLRYVLCLENNHHVDAVAESISGP